ncbi:MAG: hypothetical protein D6689_08520 [Deltaproteobacteria bacterium]|nr:MAG: hypothetical protein D6689_08520 [Deltaproteobacteria bacterium]
MATLEIGPLTNFLDDDEIAAIMRALEEHGAPALDGDGDDDAHVIESNIDDDLLADFRDQLEANDAGCDIYLPVEFEDVFEAAGYTIGSAPALLLALANMQDDIGIDEDDEDDDDVDDDDFDDDDIGPEPLGFDDDANAIDLKDQHMRHLWRAFHRGANAAIHRNVPLFVRMD